MRVTNKYGLPKVLENVLHRDPYTKGASYRSATQLGDSPRIALLRQIHDDEIEMDVSDSIFLILGKIGHMVMEEGVDERSVAERRYFTDVNGITISGQIDLYNEADGTVTIYDHKFTKTWTVTHGDKEDWQRQLNVYAYLIDQETNFEVGKAYIICYLRDWDEQTARKNRDYPRAPVMQLEIPLWSKEDRARYVLERTRCHAEASMRHGLHGEIPECTDEERWKRPDKYQVWADRNKMPSGTYDTIEEADERCRELNVKARSGRSYGVIAKRGEPIRCQRNYCRVADFCDQWQRDKRLYAGGEQTGEREPAPNFKPDTDHEEDRKDVFFA